MRRSKKFMASGLDGLEARVVLSTAVTGLGAEVAAPQVAARPKSLKAAFVVPLDNSLGETATAIPVNGQGMIRPLGIAQVTGSLQGEGKKGTGDLVLMHEQGTLTLRLRRPQQSGTARSPVVTMRYRITNGSGVFTGARGAGSAVFQLGVIRKSDSLVGMTLNLKGPVRYA